ncbi:chemotaxis response regulator protein-glutamate methylesterase [Paraferrimonas sp. SM1919]|uniref:protein-glutamate methylesterase/protein-glutamine glutaminase n=1 Tax=Paraferrimonas sp. SM1919 TaxID=2662263 RepID=UPI0013D293C0|nr:chemotaxis response regulator protein-glutamate methylesterase [Paraferrimonas sp. SM1919]
MKIKVLIVDASVSVCHAMRAIINSQNDLQVVGFAQDPYQARTLIKSHKPDVLVLSIELPKMDGMSFLRKIMTLRPMPVIIFSKLLAVQPALVKKAKDIGAFACLEKPQTEAEIAKVAPLLIKYIHRSYFRFNHQEVAEHPLGIKSEPMITIAHKIIAIGASTGGTEALTTLLQMMPVDCPAIVIVQHMPFGFTKSFASRLQSQCQIEVCEANHNQLLKKGTAYIAPGDKHLIIQKRSGCFYTILSEEAPLNKHRPSIDLLFDSVAEHARHNSIGVILTGMGKDGANGLLAMKQAGAKTIIQDEQTSVIYGMPFAAKKLGAADYELALNRIAPTLIQLVKK